MEGGNIFAKVLRILPPKFNTLAMTLEERKDLSEFSLDEMKSSLINHEHILNRSSMSLENIFSTQSSISRGKEISSHSSVCSSNLGYTSGRSQNPSTIHSSCQRTEKSKIQCHYYKKYGHYAYECRKRQYIQNKQGQN